MCLQPAEQGGENLLARNADMLPNLPPSLLDTFEQKGGIRCALLLLLLLLGTTGLMLLGSASRPGSRSQQSDS